MSTHIFARTLVTTLVKSVFTPASSYTFLHPDDDATYQDTLRTGKIPVRVFTPILIADSIRLGGLLWWYCVVEIATITIDAAEKEADKLLAILTPDPTRIARENIQPRTRILREHGYARGNIQFRQITDA